MVIDRTNTRRFTGPEGQVLDIYDHCRAWTKYADVGCIEGRVAFVSAPRTYFADEIYEIDNGGNY